MRAELGLPSVRGDDEKGGGMMGGFGGSMGGVGGGKGKRPISVKFEIPYFTTSGIQVRYLKIIEPKVRERGVRLLSNAKLTDYAAPISVFAVGKIYHAVRRHRGEVARCQLEGLIGRDGGRCIPMKMRSPDNASTCTVLLISW